MRVLNPQDQPTACKYALKRIFKSEKSIASKSIPNEVIALPISTMAHKLDQPFQKWTGLINWRKDARKLVHIMT